MRSVRWLGLLGLYVGALIVGLALANPFRSEGLSSTSNAQSPTAPLLLIFVIVAAPLAILLFVRMRGAMATLRQLILILIAGSMFVTLYATFSLFPPGTILLPPYGAEIGYNPALSFAGAAAAVIFLALLMEPQWYVVDFAGFVAAGALVAILGISFGILPAFILLLALMVYDAIAVYRTKHMVSLADVVTEMKLPILLVMPDSAGYDYTDIAHAQGAAGAADRGTVGDVHGSRRHRDPGHPGRVGVRLASDEPRDSSGSERTSSSRWGPSSARSSATEC